MGRRVVGAVEPARFERCVELSRARLPISHSPQASPSSPTPVTCPTPTRPTFSCSSLRSSAPARVRALPPLRGSLLRQLLSRLRVQGGARTWHASLASQLCALRVRLRLRCRRSHGTLLLGRPRPLRARQWRQLYAGASMSPMKRTAGSYAAAPGPLARLRHRKGCWARRPAGLVRSRLQRGAVRL